MPYLGLILLSFHGVESSVGRRGYEGDPCTALHERSSCIGGICRSLFYVGDLVQDAVYVVDSIEVSRMNSPPPNLKCTQAAETDSSKEYILNRDFFYSRIRELILVTDRDLIPAVNRFPLSAQELSGIMDTLNEEHGYLQASGKNVLEILFSWKAVEVSPEFCFLKEVARSLLKSLSVSHPFHKMTLSGVLDRLLLLPTEFGADMLTPLLVFPSTVDDFLGISEFIEELNEIMESANTIAEEDEHTLAEFLHYVLSSDQNRGDIALLTLRLKQVICQRPYDIIQLMASELSFTAEEMSTVFWLCRESFATVERIEIGKLVAQAFARVSQPPHHRRLESLTISSYNPQTIVDESRAFLGTRDISLDFSIPLIVNIEGDIISIRQWLGAIVPICSDPEIFSSRGPKLMLRPYDYSRDPTKNLRACGRLLGIALRGNVKLGLDFDLKFFELLRISSPSRVDIDAEFSDEGHLEAARIIREGIADILSYLAIHSFTEIELHEAFV